MTAMTLRSALTLLLAVLGVFALDGADARRGKYGKIAKKKCGKKNGKCCAVGPGKAEAPCRKKWFRCVGKGMGKCKPCGGKGQRVCIETDKQPKCVRHLVVSNNGKKCIKEKCGGYDLKCCRGKFCNAKNKLSCQAGKCKPCGDPGAECCPRGKACLNAGTICASDNDGKHKCLHCGGVGDKCCKFGGCDKGNRCKNGHCQKIPCDKKGDKCCKGSKCDGRFNCEKAGMGKGGRCQPCGGKNKACCRGAGKDECDMGFKCEDTGKKNKRDFRCKMIKDKKPKDMGPKDKGPKDKGPKDKTPEK